MPTHDDFIFAWIGAKKSVVVIPNVIIVRHSVFINSSGGMNPECPDDQCFHPGAIAWYGGAAISYFAVIPDSANEKTMKAIDRIWNQS